MDDARAGRKILRAADHAIVEAHADADHQVSVVHRQIGLHRPVHANHAQGLRVLLGERAKAEQRGPNGDVAGLREAQQLGRRVRHRDTVSDDQDWPFGRVEQCRGLIERELGCRAEYRFELS